MELKTHLLGVNAETSFHDQGHAIKDTPAERNLRKSFFMTRAMELKTHLLGVTSETCFSHDQFHDYNERGNAYINALCA